MLSDAIEEIHREFEAADDRRSHELKRRADVRRVDDFLLSIEDIIENRRGAVPAPLMDDITRFVRPLSRKLLRALNRNVRVTRCASWTCSSIASNCCCRG